MNIHRAKNKDAMIENNIGGKLLFILFFSITFAILVTQISNIVNIKWFWCIVIAIFIVLFLSRMSAIIYSTFLGYKTKPHLSSSTLDYVRSNLHIIDALITFGLGFILFLISN